MQHVDSGEIRVFGRNPGQQGLPGQMLGYMPQETSLYPTLTIMEMLQYFGMLYGMEKDKIEERTNFLVKFLQLPVDAGKPVSPQGRIIASLSGGEQRRTSFALSLLADPPLLILDEPVKILHFNILTKIALRIKRHLDLDCWSRPTSARRDLESFG